MPAIFISHSSQDSEAAAATAELLHERGYRSVFLDFDPEHGIPAGRDWQRELYAELQACRAVITLLSPHAVASKWCFAETTQALAMGKPIFPVKIAECELDPALAAYQAIDVAGEGSSAWERLWAGLELHGLDPGASFDWDRNRPPYPGLMAFGEQDAAVFFGRDAEIQDALERLNSMRRFGGPGLLVVLGASGSGKSSLLRAGLLPRLGRDADAWLVLDAMRPRTDPLRELANVVASAFDAAGETRSRQQIEESLDAPDAGTRFAELLLALQIANGRSDACIVLSLDQMEELFASSPARNAKEFLQLLGAALQRTGLPLVVVATLRSDFLGDLQREAAPLGIAFDNVSVGPMTADDLVEVINGPARVSAITIEPGLTEALLEDTGTDDALPLLAYTLRELYERFGADRKLELKEYRDGLGGLAASIAVAAESVLAADPQLDLKSLRRAFAKLVRVDEEGHFARRPAAWSELPPPVHGALEQFVRARLLIAGGDGSERTLEVAHEALFRSWERLRKWLDEDREQLLWQQRMRSAIDEWQRSGQDVGALLRGGRLAEATRWLEHGADLPADVRAFVQESAAQQRAEQARVERNRRRTLVSLAGGLGVAILFGIFAATQWMRAAEQRRVADRQTQVAVARQLGSQAQLLAEDVQSEPVQRALLVAESLRRLPTLQAFVAWTALQGNMPKLDDVFEYDAEQTSVAWSPDGTLLASGNERGAVDVRRVATGERVFSAQLRDSVGDVAFSPDGTLLAVAEKYGAGDAYLWNVADGTQRARLEQIDGSGQLAFSPDGRLLVTVADTSDFGPASRTVFHLWDTATGEMQASLVHDGDHSTQDMTFSPDGRLLATTGPDKSVRLWNVATGEQVGYLEEPYGAYAVDFSPDGRLLATGAMWDGEIRIWDVETETVLHQLKQEDAAFVYHVRFNPDGTRLATGGNAPFSTIWDVATGARLFDIETVNAPQDFEFNEHGSELATLTSGPFVSAGNARLWDMQTGTELARFAPEVASSSIAFSPDYGRIATAGGDTAVRVWSLGGSTGERHFDHGEELFGAVLTPDGARLVSYGFSAKVWDLDSGESRDLVYSQMNAGGQIQSADLSPDGRLVVTGYYDGTVVIWDLVTGDQRAHMDQDRSVWSVAFSPDGRMVASAGEDGTARLWSADDGRELVRVTHDDTINSVVFSPDGERFATGSADNSVRVWSVATGQQQLRLEHPYAIWDLRYSPDGSRLAALAPEDAALQVWDAISGRRDVLLEHDDLIYVAEYSPDGRQIATASRDKSVVIWNAATGERVQRLVHPGPAIGASFSPDSRWIATWDAWRGPARIWEVATGTEVARFPTDGESSFVDAAFSPDGSQVVTSREDGLVTIHNWRAEDIVADICSRITRNLTGDEWRRFVGDEPYRPTCPGIAPGVED